MKKLALWLAGVLCVAASVPSVFGQTASATWPLSSTTTVTASDTGLVAGGDEGMANMTINNYAGPGSSQRVAVTGGSWPAETVQNDSRYIEFDVSPAAGNDFHVTSIALGLGASGGGNMRANIWYSTDPAFSARTQLNSAELALPNGSLSSLAYAPSITVNSGSTLRVRIYPWYTSASSGKYVCPQNVVVAGTTAGASAYISLSSGSLPAFQQTEGVPSAPQSYTLAATSLSADVTVTPPSAFELSTDGGVTWSSAALVLPESGGSLPGQPVSIAVRLNGPSPAAYSGTISHSSAGATTQTVAVSGVTLATEPTVPASVSFGGVTGTSMDISCSGGNGARRVIVMRSSGGVSWAPTDGNSVGGVNSNFSLASDQGGGNRAVYDGGGTGVTVTGLMSNTTYGVAVYEYNVGSGNSQNYDTASPGIGSQSTLAVPVLVVSPGLLAFGGVDINTSSAEKTYTVSGTALTPSEGTVTVGSPAGFEISVTGDSGFSTAINLPYSGGTLGETVVAVRFLPISASPYSGSITHAGGGAPAAGVTVTGTGIGPAVPNVFEAENGILTSAYISTQYPGYSGMGYVDVADKTGASLEIDFRRATAASDTVRVLYANGGSSRAYAVTVNGTAVGSLTFSSTGSWSAWSSVAMVMPLQAGINRLAFTSTTNSGNANIDRVSIGGQPATPVYKLTLAASGAGAVTASPDSLASFYDAGTQVTLTASPSAGSMFFRWMGTDPGQDDPYVVTMNSNKTLIGVMPASPGFGAFPFEPAPHGFASVGALTYPAGTTGGTGPGSQTVYVTNSDDLGNLMFRRADPDHSLNFPPLTVYVMGTLTTGAVVTDMCDVKDAYDISIIGAGVDAKLSGFGLSIVRSKNIIVRNLKVENSGIDGFTIQADDAEGTGNHIWVDHCDITNCYDGALDATHTVTYATFSWNHFYNHDKTCLMGHSDSQVSDTTMKITYHHNLFDGTVQRHPRVRYGKAHVYNNYYRNNSLYGVSSNDGAEVLLEGNYFLHVPLPTDTSRDGSIPGNLVSRNDIFDSCGAPPQTRGTTFDPATWYTYTLDDAAAIPALLTAYAGSGKFDFGGNLQPLAVELVSFIAHADGDRGFTLEWKTASETNNYGFEVQRGSAAGGPFASLPGGFVAGHGTTSQPQSYTFTDSTAAGGSWYYRLKQTDTDGGVHYSDAVHVEGIASVAVDAPSAFALGQNYPNPFNPSTTIRFSVDRASQAKLDVFTVLGQHVATLFDGIANPGRQYAVTFRADKLPSGVYVYRLRAGGHVEVKKLMVLK